MAPKAKTRQSRVGPNQEHHRLSRFRQSHFFMIILPSTMCDMKQTGNVLHCYVSMLQCFLFWLSLYEITCSFFSCCSLLLHMILVLLLDNVLCFVMQETPQEVKCLQLDMLLLLICCLYNLKCYDGWDFFNIFILFFYFI